MIAIRRKHSANCFGRSAFTVVEVLVVITVLGVLLALILPAVQRARESSRLVACANHLKNVATAILSETISDQRFPASGHWGENTTGAVVEYHNWVVSILPHLDQGNLFAAWNRQLPRNDPHNSQLAQTHVPVLLCPSDITTVSGGGLTTLSMEDSVGPRFTSPRKTAPSASMERRWISMVTGKSAMMIQHRPECLRIGRYLK